jgi:hypothetical protein
MWVSRDGGGVHSDPTVWARAYLQAIATRSKELRLDTRTRNVLEITFGKVVRVLARDPGLLDGEATLNQEETEREARGGKLREKLGLALVRNEDEQGRMHGLTELVKEMKGIILVAEGGSRPDREGWAKIADMQKATTYMGHPDGRWRRTTSDWSIWYKGQRTGGGWGRQTVEATWMAWEKAGGVWRRGNTMRCWTPPEPLGTLIAKATEVIGAQRREGRNFYGVWDERLEEKIAPLQRATGQRKRVREVLTGEISWFILGRGPAQLKRRKRRKEREREEKREKERKRRRREDRCREERMRKQRKLFDAAMVKERRRRQDQAKGKKRGRKDGGDEEETRRAYKRMWRNITERRESRKRNRSREEGGGTRGERMVRMMRRRVEKTRKGEGK